MIFKINNKVSLVVNQLTGSVVLVDNNWWNKFPFSWVGDTILSSALPNTEEFYLSNAPSEVSEEILNEMNDLGFFLTKNSYISHLQRLTDFGNLFARERQTVRLIQLLV